MEIGKIRDVAAVSVLPPREGFSPQAVGAIGIMVRLLAAGDDIVVGQDAGSTAFPTPRLEPVMPGLRPVFSRTERYMQGAVRRLRRLQPALIEVHNRANLALRIARALPNARITLFVHNDPQAMRLAKQPDQRAALLRQMTVVCVSSYLRDRFMAGVTGAGVMPRVLPNAIDLDALPPRTAAPDREKLFLFVGRVVADKGADAFVRAFGAIGPSLPGWRAAMIGADRFNADSPGTPFIRALQPRLRAAGVELRGYQPHAAVLDAMSKAAIVVVPSRWQEPFGLTALEAMASGAALICAPSGGLPELAGGAALYAPPDPPGALEHAMLTLARDQARRENLAVAGLGRAASYNAASARARLQALRRELLRGGCG